MGHSSDSGKKSAIKESKRNLVEVFIRIILQNREFFLIIGVVIGLSIWITACDEKRRTVVGAVSSHFLLVTNRL